MRLQLINNWLRESGDRHLIHSVAGGAGDVQHLTLGEQMLAQQQGGGHVHSARAAPLPSPQPPHPGLV